MLQVCDKSRRALGIYQPGPLGILTSASDLPRTYTPKPLIASLMRFQKRVWPFIQSSLLSPTGIGKRNNHSHLTGLRKIGKFHHKKLVSKPMQRFFA